MAVGDVVNGSDVLIFRSAVTGTTTWLAIAHATSHTLSVKMATRDTSNKGTSSYVTKAAGRLDVTATVEGMYIDGDTETGYSTLMTAITARTEMLLIFGKETSDGSGVPDTTTTGGVHWYASGRFICTSVDATFPDEGNSTYTATFEHVSGFVLNQLVTS